MPRMEGVKKFYYTVYADCIWLVGYSVSASFFLLSLIIPHLIIKKQETIQ